MKLGLLEILFLVSAFCVLAIRVYHRRATQGASPVVATRNTLLDTALLIAAMVAMAPIPMVYIFTPYLDLANFSVPVPLRWIGILTVFWAIFIFLRSHSDLGLNWSGFLELKERQELITHGIYRRIRHPMYAAVLIWSLGQALALTNWIAGPANIIVTLAFLGVRAPREEAMLLERFGKPYQDYMNQTGRFIPRLWR